MNQLWSETIHLDQKSSLFPVSRKLSIVTTCIDTGCEAVQAWLQSAKKKDVQEGSTGIVALVSHGFTAPVEAKAPTGCAALWPKPKDGPKWVPNG